MYPVAVVESRVWVNVKTGARRSPFTSWQAGECGPDWVRRTQGYTLAMSNGTQGYGRPPLATREEAEAVMASWLKRIGRA